MEVKNLGGSVSQGGPADELVDRTAKAEKAAKDTEVKVRDVQNSLSRVQRGLSDAENRQAANFRQHSEQITQNAEGIGSLLTHIEDLQSATSILSLDLETVDQGLEARIMSALKTMDGLRQDLAEVQAAVTDPIDHSDRLATMESEYDQLRSKVDTVSNRSTMLATENVNLFQEQQLLAKVVSSNFKLLLVGVAVVGIPIYTLIGLIVYAIAAQ